MEKNKKRFSFKTIFEEKKQCTQNEGILSKFSVRTKDYKKSRTHPEQVASRRPIRTSDDDTTSTLKQHTPRRNPVSEKRRLAIRKKIGWYGLPEIIAAVKRKKYQ